jgi:hypothetical protein
MRLSVKESGMKPIKGINFAEKAVVNLNASIFAAEGEISEPKTVQVRGMELQNMTTKIVFPVGHNTQNVSSYLTLNGIAVVSNQNGTLAPIPIHAMTEGGSTVYKVLQPNTVLEMYYTADYDGNQTPAFVIVGNPLVLSSATYSIYANGQIGNEQVATVRSILSNNVPYGWLLCDATVRNRADYPKLWDEIPSLFKNTANNTFVIDLREATLKGVGLTSKSSAHYNSTGLTLGQFIDDRFQGHHHNYGYYHGIRGTYVDVDSVDLINKDASSGAVSTRVLEPINGTNGNVRFGDTTEVKSVGVNWIIKAM